MNRETAELLQSLYQIAHLQATLSKDDLTLEIDWPGLRLRAEKALVREGVVLPSLPEIETD